MECLICYQTNNKCIEIPCGHSFCYNCIEKWVKIKPICPYCLKKISKETMLKKLLTYSPNIVTRSVTRQLKLEIYTEKVTKLIDELSHIGSQYNSIVEQNEIDKIILILKITYDNRDILLKSGNIEAFITLYRKLSEGKNTSLGTYHQYYFKYRDYLNSRLNWFE